MPIRPPASPAPSSMASETDDTTVRATWGSRLGFVLAAAGSAVGLGAVWKFPYVVGAHGGGAFLMIYLACVLTLGVALLLAEMTIGRLTGKSMTTALRALGGRRWAWVGRIATFNAFAILSFYVVVGGWTVAYLWRASRAAYWPTIRIGSSANFPRSSPTLRHRSAAWGRFSG
ncbi:hypothetical protein ACNHE5_07470 [Pandoraea pnomenusa]|uniref:hypothetical protein n=1 Tax=Pandoraea pnomenusa TaxID=93220 RepID=UPI003CF1344B